jgi:hypothetical protein
MLTPPGLIEDQDPELRVEPHLALLQVELVPDTTDLPDLRRHRDHRYRLESAHHNE